MSIYSDDVTIEVMNWPRWMEMRDWTEEEIVDLRRKGACYHDLTRMFHISNDTLSEIFEKHGLKGRLK